jgi:N utilization substance protein A
MTPEQLEEIPGIEQEMVENIQSAVVSYYGQFEEQTEPAAAVEVASEPATEAPAEASNNEAPENESDRIVSTEVPAAAPESGKGEAELS